MGFKITTKEEYPLLLEPIDLNFYKSRIRQIHKVFHGASKELEALVINFAYSKVLGIHSVPYTLSRPRLKAALELLTNSGYIKLSNNHFHNEIGKGRARTYERTALFDNTFIFSLPNRIRVDSSALSKNSSKTYTIYMAVSDMKEWHGTNKFETLVNSTELTMSDGSQVFQDVWLFRNQRTSGRLFQHGAQNYQQLSGTDRELILINGTPTVELDYKSLHPNLLLNRVGHPCVTDFYERIIMQLGLRQCKKNRNALKLVMLIAINIEAPKGFYPYLGRLHDKNGKRPIDILGVKPKQIYEGIIAAYPVLAPYICKGKLGLSLQQQDSLIMIDVLKELAKQGVLGLPVHDSVIVPIQHKQLAETTMKDCYRKHMNFDIEVK